MKWTGMAKYTDSNSKVFICQGADNFSHPMRLKESYNYIVNKDLDYICYPYVIFYCVPTNEIFKRGFYKEVKTKRPFKGYQYSFKTWYIKSLPKVYKVSSIDKWIFESIQKLARRNKGRFKFSYVRSDYWEYGFNTHGFHNLTTTRYKVFLKENEKPLSNKYYFDKWPGNIIKQLQNLKDESVLYGNRPNYKQSKNKGKKINRKVNNMIHKTVKIEENCVIRQKVEIKKNTVIKCGTILGTGTKVGEECFIGPGVITLHQNPDGVSTPSNIGNKCYIGGGAVLLPKVILEEGVVIGAGSVVLPGTYEKGTYVGNPARKVK
jgi:acetyltransferase-like isoleucine patch superfamily enzyme